MKSIDISLIMPSALGSRVMSRDTVMKAMAQNRNLHLQSVGSDDVESGSFKDMGATLVQLLCPKTTEAAVKGVCDVLKTVVKEAFETWRQRYQTKAELQKLVLLLGTKRTELDLSMPLEKLVKQLETSSIDALKQIKSI
jgi:hypothetical protein